MILYQISRENLINIYNIYIKISIIIVINYYYYIYININIYMYTNIGGFYEGLFLYKNNIYIKCRKKIKIYSL